MGDRAGMAIGIKGGISTTRRSFWQQVCSRAIDLEALDELHYFLCSALSSSNQLVAGTIEALSTEVAIRHVIVATGDDTHGRVLKDKQDPHHPPPAVPSQQTTCIENNDR